MGSKGPTVDPANQDPDRRRLRQSRERARGRDVEKPHRIDERLRELAVAYGVATAYRDEEGTRRRVTSQSLQRVLEVLGVRAKTAEDFGQNEACTRSAAEPMTRGVPAGRAFPATWRP